MSLLNYYGDDRVNLLELSYYDDADSYEVDEGGIFLNKVTGKYILLTASGCSCWDGDFDEVHFDSLDELEAALLGTEVTRYNPSLSTARWLVAEARKKVESL